MARAYSNDLRARVAHSVCVAPIGTGDGGPPWRRASAVMWSQRLRTAGTAAAGTGAGGGRGFRPRRRMDADAHDGAG